MKRVTNYFVAMLLTLCAFSCQDNNEPVMLQQERESVSNTVARHRFSSVDEMMAMIKSAKSNGRRVKGVDDNRFVDTGVQ